MDKILEVNHLNAYYKQKQILHDINLHVDSGEIVGLVGESGCGKSTLAKSILNIGPKVDGEIVKAGRFQMIFQDPYHSLNPSMTIGRILEEPLILAGYGNREERNARVRSMMERVELNSELINRYPSELSGGQRQRVCIGAALMMSPKLIIADEPVSALDVTIQAKVLKLLQRLNREEGIAFLFISHDLRVVYELCSRILIMKDGRIVEEGPDRQIFEAPREDYTRKLISAIL